MSAPVLAGEWGPVRITGDRDIYVDGFLYSVPSTAAVKVVTARKVAVVHVLLFRVDGKPEHVAVLCQGRQLVEPPRDAHSRAVSGNWFLVGGDLL